MDARETATIERLLTSDARVLEFGAGGSTLWLAARTREVHSVEHEQEWVNKITVVQPKNVTVHWRQPAFAHRNHEPAKPGQFSEYISVPEQLGVMFDVCLVDGRARIECALAAARWLKTRGWLLFHDWFPRARYTSRLAELAPFYGLREDLSVRDTRQTLAVFERSDIG